MQELNKMKESYENLSDDAIQTDYLVAQEEPDDQAKANQRVSKAERKARGNQNQTASFDQNLIQPNEDSFVDESIQIDSGKKIPQTTKAADSGFKSFGKLTEQKKVPGLASRNHGVSSVKKKTTKKQPKLDDIIVFKEDPDDVDQKLILVNQSKKSID